MNTPAKCPACRRPVPATGDNPWRPFCSERCRLVDLGGWLAGRYAIPVQDAPPAVPDADPDTTRH